MYPDEISLEAPSSIDNYRGGDRRDEDEYSLSVHNRLSSNIVSECPVESVAYVPVEDFSSQCFINVVNCPRTSVVMCEGPRGSGKSLGCVRAIIQNLVRAVGESLVNHNPLEETPFEEINSGAYIEKYCSLLAICTSSDLAAAALYYSIELLCNSTRLFGNLIVDRKSAVEASQRPANIVVCTIQGLREVLYADPNIFSRVVYVYIHDAYKFVPVWSM